VIDCGVEWEGRVIPSWNQQLMEQSAAITRYLLGKMEYSAGHERGTKKRL